eukprot:gnl/Hemi2/16702_TR5601_c0_g3_i1.p1 gnl/Hemi2/16702_TR5601_c0_g3~~gnl/Hemi2/16702_TR5601_c0_g3_i1.p1  ORF type:complete len:369 (-),score=143.77 gnl/Hemi2/16702_TR5601_c0_g3_i1:153-1259(-)
MAHAIERRRELEAERKKRIFDPRTRQMGVDKTGLDAQVDEKRRLREEEQQRNALHDQALIAADAQAQAIQKDVERQRRAVLQETNKFRQEQQTFSQRREFDLNDPRAKSKDIPARLDDEDPRLGASSLQKFRGEDLSAKERSRIQQSQQKDWVTQQVAEKMQRQRDENDQERRYADYCQNVAEYVSAVEEDKRLDKLEQNLSVRNFNLSQAASRKEAERQAVLQKYREDQNEINYQLNSDILTENPDLAKTDLGPHRINRPHFKGLRPDQHQDILNIQQQQREQLNRQRANDKAEEARWAQHVKDTQRAVTIQESEWRRQQREFAIEEAQRLKRQAAESKDRENYMNKTVYVNQVDDAFFEQFGTTTR